MKSVGFRLQAILKTLKGLNNIITYFLFNPFRVRAHICTVFPRFHRGLFKLNPFRIIHFTLKFAYFYGRFVVLYIHDYMKNLGNTEGVNFLKNVISIFKINVLAR